MDRILLGMLTPSSNTVLEPVTQDMLRELPQASAHFGRFAVTRIALSTDALAQFDTAGILAAAQLLSHARCQVIGWSGTSSSWLGFESDQALCREIDGSARGGQVGAAIELGPELQQAFAAARTWLAAQRRLVDSAPAADQPR